MNRYLQILSAVLLTAAALLVACDSQQPATTLPTTVPSTTTPEKPLAANYDVLLRGLQFAGTVVEPAGSVSQPFFTPQGQVISVDGQELQVFEYESEADAEAEAALVSADGSSVGASIMTWIATPHFYKHGKLIVLYVGDDSYIIDLLESIIGSQFAGG